MMIFIIALFVSFISYGFYVLGYETAGTKHCKTATTTQKNAVEALLIADEYKKAYAQLKKERER